MQEFIVFKSFTHKEDAAPTLQTLSAYNIHYECDEFTDRYFKIEMGDSGIKGFFIKLQAKDFEKARKVLRQEAQNLISEIPEDYYLYSFSAKELVEIIQKPDEWNELDYELAKYLLAEQGIEISPEQEKEIIQKRDNERTQAKAASWKMIIIAFLLLPLLYGVVLGWELYTSQKVTSNGQKTYVYDEQSRLIGKILVISPILVIFFILYKMLSSSN